MSRHHSWRAWNSRLCRLVTLVRLDLRSGGEPVNEARSIDGARWLIAAAAESKKVLTNFQVQKLLYYAHGEYLKRHSEPLFREGFQAWEHGPVCPPAYRAFSSFGAGPVMNVQYDRDRIAARLNDDVVSVLRQIWSDYGDWSVTELWDDTHQKGSPWEQVYEEGITHAQIDDSDIRRYFLDLQSPRLRRSMNRLRKRRDERGEPPSPVIGDGGIASEIEAWSHLRAAGTHGLLG